MYILLAIALFIIAIYKFATGAMVASTLALLGIIVAILSYKVYRLEKRAEKEN